MKWYQKNWFCVLMLVVFAPIGIVLAWKYQPKWKKQVKIVLSLYTVLWTACMIGIINTKPVKKIALPEEVIKLEVGKEQTIDVTLTPENTTSTLTYLSENEEIALFEEKETGKGIVKALKEGETTIYVESHDIKSNKVKVVVNDSKKDEQRKKAADEVKKQIDALKIIELKDKDAIIAARKAYDQLDEKGKSYVDTIETLEQAESSYQKLTQQAEDDATAVDQLIENIGKVTLDKEASIQKADRAYQALSKEARNKVQHYDQLQGAKKAYQKLQDQQNKKEEPPQASNSQKTVDQNGQIVYWTPNGKKYHVSSNCSTLKRSKTINSGSIEQAIGLGKGDLCKVCGR